MHEHTQPTLSVAAARERLVSRLAPLPAESIPLARALGRVLAEDVVAGDDLPPFANASMDGYAVRAADLAKAADDSVVDLTVVGDIAAGGAGATPIASGEAMRIMTGAPLPPGADAVVPVEWTGSNSAMVDQALPSSIEVARPLSSGDFVRAAGQDVQRGTVVLERGRRLRPPDIAMLAALGVEAPRVSQRPKVAILSTGDELIEPGQSLSPGRIRDANGFGLQAAVQEAGGEPWRLPIAADTEESVHARFRHAVQGSASLVISSGGVSMGAFDYVRHVLETFGSLEFWRVNIRPGKPLAFGSFEDVPFIGLPGNPVSALVTFEVFVRPALARMAGRQELTKRAIHVRLAHDLESDGRESYLRANLSWDGGSYLARLSGSQDSGVLSSMIAADAFIIVPAGARNLKAGEWVEAWPLGEG